MIKMKKNGQRVWVTFTVSPEDIMQSVAISGEWNDWKIEPMKQKKSGEFSITKVLKAGNTFQFGYQINDSQWVVDSECETIASPFHSENSLIKL